MQVMVILELLYGGSR